MGNRKNVLGTLVTVVVAGFATLAIAQTTPTRARANLYMAGGTPTGTPLGYVDITEIGGGYLKDAINISGRVPASFAGRRYGLHLFAGSCSSLTGHLGGASSCTPTGLPCSLDQTHGDMLCSVPPAFCTATGTIEGEGGVCTAVDGGPWMVAQPCLSDSVPWDIFCNGTEMCGVVNGSGFCTYIYDPNAPCGGGQTGGASHPHDVGDLPNISPASSTGNFSLSKATNRFTLSRDSLKPWQQQLNLWNHAGTVSVVVDAGADYGSGEGGGPMLCGELNCAGGTCDQFGGGK